MKLFQLALLLALIISCKHQDLNKNNSNAQQAVLDIAKEIPAAQQVQSDFTIVFASCNDQNRDQPLWKPILETKPNLFIWGGDNIYADTADMQKMKADYDKVWANPEYKTLAASVPIIGTWDDHDYGKNDAGSEWEHKKEAQRLFLDFLKTPENDPLRTQEGIYYTKIYNTKKGRLKIILLDTRTFRDSLRKSKNPDWRFEAWDDGKSRTVLGTTQWKWLQKELEDETSDFNIIVSSIQFLADEHGWEKWANFPSEVKKMQTTLENAKAKNIIFLSGDRHLAEFSVNTETKLTYPLVDFTTSGLTHTWPENPDGPNRYRKGELIKDLNFGIIKIDFLNKKVLMEIRGLNNQLREYYFQQY
ncbi:alkaline phosphatase D family protein [Ulvibacter antarcticus]|uniref:Alkaline phosphatase D n=1 Tax=Ulvibacter antarcticus TaxID=442714 RepID=A0A3L9YHC0_9FLAO|nr:alkaline phosphatase D family protein [Ulvibacter antarcticus]RMA58589.1 alkaline phosphatase D [Ulvibacter antarcticus]